jgi:hypothetical protein
MKKKCVHRTQIIELTAKVNRGHNSKIVISIITKTELDLCMAVKNIVYT